MSEITPPSSTPRAFLETTRQDNWWIAPMATTLALLAFIVYASWRAFENTHYMVSSYISPFYSPLITVDWWGFSPAFMIVWVPAGFRFTCYYFRKAYYRAFTFTPPACAVGARPQKVYKGERVLMVFQNLHRYFLYLAILFLVLHLSDVYHAFFFNGEFGVRMGSIIIMLDVVFLAFYVVGCNSFRHLFGGNVNCYSCASFGDARHKAWKLSTIFNIRHREWAWISMVWVMITDFYVRLLATGAITDIQLF